MVNVNNAKKQKEKKRKENEDSTFIPILSRADPTGRAHFPRAAKKIDNNDEGQEQLQRLEIRA